MKVIYLEPKSKHIWGNLEHDAEAGFMAIVFINKCKDGRPQRRREATFYFQSDFNIGVGYMVCSEHVVTHHIIFIPPLLRMVIMMYVWPLTLCVWFYFFLLRTLWGPQTPLPWWGLPDDHREMWWHPTVFWWKRWTCFMWWAHWPTSGSEMENFFPLITVPSLFLLQVRNVQRLKEAAVTLASMSHGG